MATVTVQCWGAGGGGAKFVGNSPYGGGGGAFAQKNVSVSDLTSYSIVVGTGGIGASTNPSDGTNGGGSYFVDTSTVYAKGGSAGLYASSGGAGAPATGAGTTQYAGGSGASIYGGGGGAGTTQNGSGATPSGGGTGGSADGGNGGGQTTNGSLYGGGGGPSPVAANAGNGANGKVVVYYTTGTLTATGGTITTGGGNTYHTFTSSGTFRAQGMMSATNVTYSFTGYDANLIKGKVLVADPATYTLTYNSATLAEDQLYNKPTKSATTFTYATMN